MNETPKRTQALILLTVEQVAERTQFCRNTIKKAMDDGELRYGKFGRMVRIKESDLLDWIEKKLAAKRIVAIPPPAVDDPWEATARGFSC